MKNITKKHGLRAKVESSISTICNYYVINSAERSTRAQSSLGLLYLRRAEKLVDLGMLANYNYEFNLFRNRDT